MTEDDKELVDGLRKTQCPNNMGCNPLVRSCQCAIMDEAADRIESLEAQIDRLASFIMHCIEGEPSQSQGAVDTAIRIMTEQATTIGEQLAEVERLRGALKRIQHFSPAHMWRAPDIQAIIRAALGETK